MKLILRHFANRLMIPRRNKKSVQPQITNKRRLRVLICFSDVESKIIISSAVTSIFFYHMFIAWTEVGALGVSYKIRPQGAFSILVFTTPVKTGIFGVIKHACTQRCFWHGVFSSWLYVKSYVKLWQKNDKCLMMIMKVIFIQLVVLTN